VQIDNTQNLADACILFESSIQEFFSENWEESRIDLPRPSNRSTKIPQGCL